MSKVSARAGVRPGQYRVEHDGRVEVVFVAGDPNDPWAFWNGHVFHGGLGPTSGTQVTSRDGHRAPQAITAPMPATVVKVLVERGAVVKKGDAMVILEAMKMELPLRASTDGTVSAVHCRDGDLVQPDTVLVELT